MSDHTVLVVGATGRTGGRVVQQLLERGANVRVIVRSATRLPEGVAGHPRLQVLEADLLSLPAEELQRQVVGCDAVISCLGHVISLKGVFGPPHDLVTQAAARLCDTIRMTQPATPVKFILMSSVSVNRPGRADTRRGSLERAVLGIMRVAIPPAKDNQTSRGLPRCGSRNRRPVRRVGGRSSRHAARGRRHRVLAARNSGRESLQARRHEQGKRRALHVRAGDGCECVGHVEGQAAGDCELGTQVMPTRPL